MRLVKMSELEVRTPVAGYNGRFVHGEKVTVAYWDVAEGAALPAHSHPHEQVVNIMDGEFELVVDGATVRMAAGMAFAIPGGVFHSGRALTPCRIIDVFSPVREDYR